MTQLTVRVSEELAAKLRAVAGARGVSANALLTQAIEILTGAGPHHSEAERLRDRLRAAGLLAPLPAAAPVARVDDAEFDAARRAAGGGTPLADLVSQGRE